MKDVLTLAYADTDMIKQPVSWSDIGSGLSSFDEKLRAAWNKAAENGILRYTLSDCLYKTLDLKCDSPMNLPCVAMLNHQRAVNRRKREDFQTMNDSFSDERFNFKKIKDDEILMQLSNNNMSSYGHCQNLVINISPIEYGHVLLVPSLQNGLPQRCTTDSLLIAFDTLELSSQPSFRLGFNSIHAWASINHLHFHGMYCDHEIFCDSLPAEDHLASSCYLLHSSSPLHAFVFTVPVAHEDRLEIAKSITGITEILHSMAIPYNIMICRGQVMKKDGSRDMKWSTRTLVFPRKSTKGMQPADPFDVACVEAGGLFPVKTPDSFNELTPEIARRILTSARLEDEVFDAVKEKVKSFL